MKTQSLKTTLAALVIALVGISVSELKANTAYSLDASHENLNITYEKPEANADQRAVAKALLRENLNSIKFIENKGQWPTDVLYVGKSSTGNVAIYKDRLAFSTPQYIANDQDKHSGKGSLDSSLKVGAHEWALKFEQANRVHNIEVGSPFVTQFNYFTDGDQGSVSQVQAYKEITLIDVYPGIDLRLYGRENGKLEFDWLLDAGADYAQIKLSAHGVDGLSVLDEGALEIDLRHSDVRMALPETYQVTQNGKQLLTAGFTVNNNLLAYYIEGELDPTAPLVIDPDLDWGTYMDNTGTAGSGTFDQYLYAVDVTEAFVAYVAGVTDETIPMGDGSGYMELDQTLLPTPYDDTGSATANQPDGIVYALSADGTEVLFATHFGGTDNEYIFDVSVSPDATAVWVGGQTESSTGEGFPATADALDGTLDGGRAGFVAKFSADLSTLDYASYIDSSDAGQAAGGTSTVPSETVFEVVAMDADTVIVGGILGAANAALISANAADSSYAGGDEAWIGQLTINNGAASDLSYGTYVGSAGGDYFNAIEVLGDGRVSFVGTTTTTDGQKAGFTAGVNDIGYRTSSCTGRSPFVGVLDLTDGALDHLSLICTVGGTDGIAIDDGGVFLYIGGVTDSNDIHVVETVDSLEAGSLNLTKSGGTDGWIAKIPIDGSTGDITADWYAKYFGGNGNDTINTINIPFSKGAFLFGTTESTDLVTLNSAGNITGTASDADPGGTFYSNSLSTPVDANQDRDFYFAVVDFQLDELVYTTYAGGDRNDYLGQTGVARGANHVYVRSDTKALWVATTGHSQQDTITPDFIGKPNAVPAISDILAVFDGEKTATPTQGNDYHVILKMGPLDLESKDFGDAPDSYATDQANGGEGSGPFHRIPFDFATGTFKSDTYIGATPPDEDLFPGNNGGHLHGC